MSRQIHTYEGMDLVKQNYLASGLSDTEFAAQMTTMLKRSYSVAQVRSYRFALGIANNKEKGASQLAKAINLLSRAYRLLPETAAGESLAQEIDEFLA
jgi:hypothetical protein